MKGHGHFDFDGTERFTVLRRLGGGGMGAVYEALDRSSDERIALKTLPRADASLLYRLKNEFRSLQGLHHPNLIRLGELIEQRGRWFFTMELLDGVDFVSYVRAPEAEAQDTVAERPLARRHIGEAHTLDASLDEVVVPESCGGPRARAGAFDEERLRRALSGVVSGVLALHDAGLVHRDVKPSNILCTRSGRIVVLDFGLVQDVVSSGSDSGSSSDEQVLGTPAYMSPEQAHGGILTGASDWYSVGVTLYQALTGQLPFGGTAVKMLMAKQTSRPSPPSRLADGIPADLEALCMDLLAPRPEERPDDAAMRARLGLGRDESAQIPVPRDALRFVGRAGELTALAEAFAATHRGRPVAVWVSGRSGMGKTALIDHFLGGVRGRDDSVVLTGRCYERESVPYKALDNLIDDLSVYLRGVPPARVGSLLPRHIAALARVFPVLAQVEAVANAPWGKVDDYEPGELRSRAFAALKELLGRIADRSALVLFIDDLQWGDLDSAALMSELLRPPDAPAMLLIGSYRSEDAAGPIVRALEDIRARSGEAVEIRSVALEPLAAADVRNLALLLADDDDSGAHERAEAAVRECAGVPFFVGEVMRARASGAVTLEQVIMRRVAALPDDVRRLLQVIAVVGRPLPQSLAIRAAEIPGGAAALDYLRSAHMVRTRGTDAADPVEPIHDRIRETVVDSLDEATRSDIHTRLAMVLVESEWLDSQMLGIDFVASADGERARAYALAAAERAETSLAFDRAASLYRLALELSPAGDLALLGKHAEMLSHAGRGAEAAEVYTRIAELAEDADDRLEARRRAADDLLRGGHIEEGLARLAEVMSSLGVPVARTRRRAIASLLAKRLRLATRGLRFTARTERDVRPRDLARIDSLFAASSTLAMIDHLRGAAVQTQHLLLALRLGEERRVCRALVTEVAFLAVQGKRGTRRADELARRVSLQAERLGDTYLVGGARLATGMVAFFSGRYRPAHDCFCEAERLLAESRPGTWWERNTARFFLYLAKINSGDLVGVARIVEDTVAEAERRRDVYTRNLFKAHPTVWCLLREDRPDHADAELDGALEGWPEDAYFQAHHVVRVARVMVRLYAGNGREAVALLDESRPMIRALMIDRVPFVMGEVHKLSGLAGLQTGDLLRVERAAVRLEKLGLPIGRAFASQLRGAVAAAAGQREEAERLLAAAASDFDESGSAHDSAAARYRLGEVLGGTRGDALMREAHEWMRAQGVVAPQRMIDFLCPRAGG